MTLYLKSVNNLTDVDSLDCARKNLGLGSMATQFSNAVNIEGGRVVADSLVYNHASRNHAAPVALLKVGDTNLVEYQNVYHDWAFNSQSEIDVLQFKFDLAAGEDQFVRRKDLEQIAFTGDARDLSRKEGFFASRLVNDIHYLHVKSNLEDVSNKDFARSNLGLGTLGLSNWDSIFVLNSLSISSLYLDIDTKESDVKTLLAIENNKVVPYSIQNANDERYGLVKLTDNIFSAANDAYAIPTVDAMNAFYNLTLNKITSIDVNNLTLSYDVNTIIESYGLMRIENNLSEIPITDLYRSLHLGTLSKMNKGEDLVLRDVIFDDHATIRFAGDTDGLLRYLMVNEKGELTKSTAKPIATDKQPGMVFLMSNYIEDYQLGGITKAMSKFRNDVVPSAGAVKQFFELYDFKVKALEKSIPQTIKDISGFEDFMMIDDNMYVDNPSIARTNLELAEVAHTGSWDDILNKPTGISYFNNDMGYLRTANYLSEIKGQADQARLNLGLGTLATCDSNAVQFLSGSGVFDDLRVKTNFQFDKGADNQDKFLRCTNPQGNAEWAALPKARQNQFGIVCVTNNLNDNDDGKAVASSMMYKLYTEMKTRLDIYLNLITNLSSV
jgi:hypothetical protein